MKFSLKAFLVTLCGVGAAAGMMTKLLLESPENFLQVTYLASTVGPFLLAVGTIIWLGLRGNHNRKLVAWGLCLLLVPLLTFALITLLLPTGNPLSLLTTQRLIERRLPNQVDEPWVWNELTDRLNRGKLSKQQVAEAVDELISYMTATRPGGWNQPLHWQGKFLGTVIRRGMVTDAQRWKLCDAFFGPQPKVSPIPSPVAGQQDLRLDMKFGSPWARNSAIDSGLGIQLLWDVKRVRLDGTPVEIAQSNRFAQGWSGMFQGPLTAGDHEFEFEVECAYVDENKVPANNAIQIPIEQWPKAKKRWTAVVTAPVRVEPAGDVN